jgi:hypothetical protein
MATGYTPRGVGARYFWPGMSVLAGLMAIHEWDRPSLPPYTGRWSWASQIAYEAFGSRGEFVLLTGLALCALLGGVVGWQRKKERKRNVL